MGILNLVPSVTNKNTKLGIASVLMNFAVAYKEKVEGLSDGKEDIIRASAKLMSLSADIPDSQMRCMLAAGTIVVCRGVPDATLKATASAHFSGPLAGAGADPKVAEITAE